MADEAFLPAGHKPVWLQCRKKDSLLDRLKFIVKKFENVKQYKNKTILYAGNLNYKVRKFCETQNWNCLPAQNIFGTEAQVIIMLNCWIVPEYITRATNLLI